MYYAITIGRDGTITYTQYTGLAYATKDACNNFRAGCNTQVRDSDNNIIADCIHRSNAYRVPDCTTW